MSNGVNESKSSTDMKFEMFSYAIEDVRKEARQVAAVGLAVVGLRYNDTLGKLIVSFDSGRMAWTIRICSWCWLYIRGWLHLL
ncbi:hypothetical protein [Bartonella sp. AP331QHHD]|uniref:hypothetical protein n=1 Tax=Bartonella sp. AP331QHHD TaxID=3243490 RepID=UPI0035CF54C8